MDKLKYLLRSRKFWAAFVGLVMILVTTWVPDFPISEEQILNIVLIIVAYITGTALEDDLSNRQ